MDKRLQARIEYAAAAAFLLTAILVGVSTFERWSTTSSVAAAYDGYQRGTVTGLESISDLVAADALDPLPFHLWGLTKLDQESGAEEALSKFQRAVELAPDLTSARIGAGCAQLIIAEAAEDAARGPAIETARQTLQAALDRHPESADAQIALAAASLAAGNSAQALRELALSQQLATLPSRSGLSAAAWNNGLAALQEHDYGEAMRSFRHFIQLEPTSVRRTLLLPRPRVGITIAPEGGEEPQPVWAGQVLLALSVALYLTELGDSTAPPPDLTDERLSAEARELSNRILARSSEVLPLLNPPLQDRSNRYGLDLDHKPPFILLSQIYNALGIASYRAGWLIEAEGRLGAIDWFDMAWANDRTNFAFRINGAQSRRCLADRLPEGSSQRNEMSGGAGVCLAEVADAATGQNELRFRMRYFAGLLYLQGDKRAQAVDQFFQAEREQPLDSGLWPPAALAAFAFLMEQQDPARSRDLYERARRGYEQWLQSEEFQRTLAGLDERTRRRTLTGTRESLLGRIDDRVRRLGRPR